MLNIQTISDTDHTSRSNEQHMRTPPKVTFTLLLLPLLLLPLPRPPPLLLLLLLLPLPLQLVEEVLRSQLLPHPLLGSRVHPSSCRVSHRTTWEVWSSFCS